MPRLAPPPPGAYGPMTYLYIYYVRICISYVCRSSIIQQKTMKINNWKLYNYLCLYIYIYMYICVFVY
jgi:hypothetical protein